MILLLLLLWLPAARSSGCHVGTKNECRQAPSVPGMEAMGEGFDVVRLHGTGAWVVDTQRWQRPGGGCTLCRNGHQGGQEQRLPAELQHWRTISHCQRRLSSALYRSAEELTASQRDAVDASWDASLELHPKPGASVAAAAAGSHSKLADFGRRRAASDRISFASQEVHCQLYQGGLGPSPRLTPHFLGLLRDLPLKTDQPSAAFLYRRFVRTFGTHYVRGVKLGGLARDVTALQTCRVTSEGRSVEEVKDCLNIEAEVQLGSKVSSQTHFQHCQEAEQEEKSRQSFHQQYSDRLSEVVGGGGAEAGTDPLLSAEAFSAWFHSLPSFPGAVHRSLEPLHLLLPRNDPRRELLRQAVSRHVLEGGRGWENASLPCPWGSLRGARGSCSCPSGPWVNEQCCPRKRGWGKLTVVVRGARGLWGDYVTGTDAFVRLRCGAGVYAATPVVWNNNNPRWDSTFDLGDVRLDGQTFQLEVWDRDNGYDDDLLGSCQRPLRSGSHPGVCYLKHGSLTFSVTAHCGPHLGGDVCQEYQALRG